MGNEWFYQRGGKQHGPVSSQRLRELARAGELDPNDLIKRDGMATWARASAAKGLFESMTAPLQRAERKDEVIQAPTNIPEQPVTAAQGAADESITPAAGDDPSDAKPEELWTYYTQQGKQEPIALSALHRMFVEGRLAPTDVVCVDDPASGERATNTLLAGDFLDKKATFVPDGEASWAYERRGKAHGPMSVYRLGRRYDDGKLDDETPVTRVGCLPMSAAAIFHPDEAAPFPGRIPLADQDDKSQMLASASVGLVAGIACWFFVGSFTANALFGMFSGAAWDFIARKILPSARLSVSPKLATFAIAGTVLFALLGPGSMAGSNSGGGSFMDGPKIRAFRKVVAKYKQQPDRFATDKERYKYNEQLERLQETFDRIDFDPGKNRKEAIAICKLYEAEIENRYSGELPRRLEIIIDSLYMKIRDGE